MKTRRPLLLPLLLVSVACRDERAGLTSTDTVASESPAAVALTLDRTSMTSAGTVIAVGALGPEMQGAAVGAFTAKLAYDTTKLAFVDSASTAEGMGAMHAKNGVVTIAAASVEGFAGGALFKATFRTVAKPASVGTLRLSIEELSGVDFADRLPADAKRRVVTVR